MAEPDEQIVIQYVIDAATAIANAQKFRAEVDVVREQIIKDAKESGLSIDDIGKSYLRLAATIKANKITALKDAFSTGDVAKFNSLAGTSFTQLIDKGALTGALKEVQSEYSKTSSVIKTSMSEAKSAQKDTEKGTKDLGTAAKDTTSIFSSLGKAILSAFGIYSVLQILRQFIGYLKEAISSAIEFTQSMFALTLSVRQLQRQGMDVTIKDFTDQISALSEKWKIFSKKEITEGISYIATLTKSLNITKDQMFQVADAAIFLATILGKDMNEASKEIALAMSSGYSEALQRAGVNINKVTIGLRGQLLGFGDNYQAMTQQQRALATLSIINEQLASQYGDATTIQDKAVGSSRKLAAAWKDLTNQIGLALLPILGRVFNFFSRVVGEALPKIVSYLTDSLYGFVSVVAASAQTVMDWWGVLSGDKSKLGFDPVEQFKMNLEAAKKSIKEAATNLGLPDLPALGVPPVEGAENALAAAEDLRKEILKSQEQLKQDLKNIEIDLQRDLAAIDLAGNYKRWDLWSEYMQHVIDLSVKAQEDILDATSKYNLDVSQENRSFNQKKEDANRKYRDQEYKAERDFREKMRRLQEDFLLDMEDALRERDARQILRLIRQYNVNNDRLKRDYANEKEDRDKAYKEELTDIERQRNDRLRIMKEEFDYRIAQIRLQLKRETAAALDKYNQEYDQLQFELQRQRDERNLKYEEQKIDLVTAQQDRLDLIASGLVQEYNLTAEWAEAIRQKLAAEFGPGGYVEGIYKYMMQMIADMTAATTGLNLPSTTGNYGEPRNPNVPGYASGGTAYANKPTLVKFGEVPEIATFTPLSQMNSWGGKGGMGGKVRIELLLSPDLEARVMDSTLSEVANVMVDVQKKR